MTAPNIRTSRLKAVEAMRLRQLSMSDWCGIAVIDSDWGALFMVELSDLANYQPYVSSFSWFDELFKPKMKSFMVEIIE